MQQILSDARIIFIGPVFYNYENLIKEKLEEFGAKVDFFPERKYNLKYSFYNNFSRGSLLRYQKAHYNEILKVIAEKKYDYLFVIRGHHMPVGFVKAIKEANPDIKTIMYQWDSLKANDYSAHIHSFDTVYSFDYVDSINQPTISYLPLFYTHDIQRITFTEKLPTNDFLSISSYRQDRYEYLLKFINYCKENNYKLHYHLYTPFTTYLKLLGKGIRLDRKVISFSPVNRQAYLDAIRDAKVIVDISPTVQTGLSIRAIEAIGAGKKLLTTNSYITCEKFYSPLQIQLWTEKQLDEFIHQPYVPCTDIDQCLLDNWLSAIFKINKS